MILIYKKVQSKNEILEKAVEVVKENGFEQLNIRTLATESAVSIGTIYNYFPSKQDLIAETVEKIWDEVFYHQSTSEPTSYLESVDWFESCVRLGAKEFPEFLKQHNRAFAKDEKETGSRVMCEYFKKIHQQFVVALKNDVGTKRNMVEMNLSEQELIMFTIENVILCVRKNEETKTLRKIIENLIR